MDQTFPEGSVCVSPLSQLSDRPVLVPNVRGLMSPGPWPGRNPSLTFPARPAPGDHPFPSIHWWLHEAAVKPLEVGTHRARVGEGH